jgi:lysyl-tRNA synthetase class I
VVDQIVPTMTYQVPSEPYAPVVSSPAANNNMENRFTDETSDNNTNAVESALMWSNRYEELSVKTEKLRDENSELKLSNTNQKHAMNQLQADLDKTKAELDDANEFLQEMDLQLNKWKSDVLGFREEMRGAQETQLKALIKIMKILGAETSELEQN